MLKLEMDPGQVLSKALSRGGDFADIYVEESRSCSIVCEDKRIEKVIYGSDAGLGIRVIHQGRSFYGYNNELSFGAALSLADLVSQGVTEASSAKQISISRKESAERLPIKLPPDEVELADKVSLVKRASEAAWAMDGRTLQVTVTYRDSLKRIAIANSEGSLLFEERLSTVFMVQVVARKGELVQTGYEAKGGTLGLELLEQEPPEKVAEVAVGRALLMLEARPAPAGKMPVVLSCQAGGTMVHEAVGHGLEADLAQQGLSVYSGKKGEQIASTAISVVDDATLPYRRGSFAFDDEGTAAQRKLLIDRGVLVNFMYDRLTAAKDKVSSTGNGRRESYRHRPIPRMTNTMILPGTASPEEIIRATERGVLVKKMGGGQVNTVTGDFVFEVMEGYLIENGKQGEPIRGATLTGNGPQVLNLIDMVGDDLGFAIGTCGKEGQGVPVSDAQPTLRIPEIVVGGQL